jgi:hypothetical protein
MTLTIEANHIKLRAYPSAGLTFEIIYSQVTQRS